MFPSQFVSFKACLFQRVDASLIGDGDTEASYPLSRLPLRSPLRRMSRLSLFPDSSRLLRPTSVRSVTDQCNPDVLSQHNENPIRPSAPFFVSSHPLPHQTRILRRVCPVFFPPSLPPPHLGTQVNIMHGSYHLLVGVGVPTGRMKLLSLGHPRIECDSYGCSVSHLDHMFHHSHFTCHRRVG